MGDIAENDPYQTSWSNINSHYMQTLYATMKKEESKEARGMQNFCQPAPWALDANYQIVDSIYYKLKLI